MVAKGGFNPFAHERDAAYLRRLAAAYRKMLPVIREGRESDYCDAQAQFAEARADELGSGDPRLPGWRS